MRSGTLRIRRKENEKSQVYAHSSICFWHIFHGTSRYRLTIFFLNYAIRFEWTNHQRKTINLSTARIAITFIMFEHEFWGLILLSLSFDGRLFDPNGIIFRKKILYFYVEKGVSSEWEIKKTHLSQPLSLLSFFTFSIFSSSALRTEDCWCCCYSYNSFVISRLFIHAHIKWASLFKIYFFNHFWIILHLIC